MKCVIFCGGKGTRMREQTEFIPKPLVDVGGKPILWHIMKIYAHYGVKDFILTLGYKGDLIKRYFYEYQWLNSDFTINLKTKAIQLNDELENMDDWNVTCADTGVDSLTSLRLYLVKKFLEGEEDFCLTYGDGVANVNINELLKYHKKAGKLVTITSPHPRSKYGLIIADKDNVVKHFQEKPVLPDSLINGGFMVVNKRVFEYMTDQNIMWEDMLQKLSLKKEVQIYPFEGFWHSMDTYQDYEQLNKIWANEKPWKIWK